MNITNLREKDFEAKQEEINSTNESKLSKLASSSSSTRQWAGSRNPRIVRVSRAFGGKDRHSKVCTIRGLRDRRIRLSVPTAIQLYDLQDRLGVGQPSKVVDWLLDVTKDDIDKLPPLQISSQGDFSQFLQPHTRNSASSSFPSFFDANNNNSPFYKGGIKINDGEDQDQEIGGSRSKNDWEFGVDGHEFFRGKDKEEDEDHMKIDQDLGHGIGSSSRGYNENNAQQVAVQNFFPIGSHSSMPGYFNNMIMPYTNNSSYYQWDPSNLSLSQFGGLQGPFASNQSQDNLQSSTPDHAHHSSLPGGSQLLFYPSTGAIPSLFPTYSPYLATQMENVPRQMNHFQEVSSSGAQQNNYPHSFQLNVSPKLIPSQNMNEIEEHEDDEEDKN